MKKSLFLFAAILFAAVCNAQSLDEIMNKYYAASGIDKIEKATTLHVEGKATQMGMEMPLVIDVKKPNKVKVVISFNGSEIITMYDGVKGYMVNPLAGMTEPMEIPAEQLESVNEYNMLRDEMMESYKAGRLKLEGEEAVEGKPAYKLTRTDSKGATTGVYIDKNTFLTTKTTQMVNQMGQEMLVESYIREYNDVNGIKFPKVVATMVNGSEMGGMVLDKVEIDVPIDDALFTLK